MAGSHRFTLVHFLIASEVSPLLPFSSPLETPSASDAHPLAILVAPTEAIDQSPSNPSTHKNQTLQARDSWPPPCH